MDKRPKTSALLGDRYELTEPIGFGGMAEVWRAHDRQLDRDVAVKLLSAAAGMDPKRRKRIEREARALASVSHPSIVSVYDYGEESEGSTVRPYIVMELVEGSDLHQHLEEKGRLEVDETREMLRAILAGVGSAHAQGIVHGDLKPANVLISSHGPKVSDFGVARIAGEETGMTTATATPTFAAPEVLRGEKPTAASDVYSVGCIAFQLLTGSPPYAGGNAWEVAAKHLEEPLPSVRTLRTDVPVELDEAIQRAMSKDPGERTSVDELREAVGAPAVRTVPVAKPVIAGASQPTEVISAPMNLRSVAVFGPLALWATGARNWFQHGRRRAVALVLVILLGAAAVAAASGVSLPSAGIEVPDVRGQTFDAAVKELEEAGFNAGVSLVSFSPVETGPGGLVLRTIPAGGTVADKGSDVHIVAGALTHTPAPSATPEKNDDDGEGKGKRKGRGSSELVPGVHVGESDD